MTVSEFVNKVGFKVKNEDINSVNNAISGIKNTATKLLGTIGIGISLSQLNAIAEEFDGIGDKLAYATEYAENLGEIQEKVLESANNCRTSYGSMVDTVASLKQANAEVFPVEEAATFVEYVNKLGKAAGYSDGEISSMTSSIQRIAAAGQATSSDLTRIARTAPALIEQICKSLGVTREELNSMADAGKVTAETVKTALLNSADDIDAAFSNLNFGVSDALLNIRNRFGFWVDEMNKALNITQTIGTTMVKAFNGVIAVLNRARTAVVWLSEKLGGAENLMKLISAAAGALLVAMNFSKIISAIQMVGKVLKAAFSIKNAGILLLVAAITVLFLLVDDFINFMKGNDSVIGYCFQKAGIDAELMRQKIVNIWNNLKTFFSGIWNSIKSIISPVLDWIKQKLEDVFGDDLFADLGNGIAGVINFFERLTTALAGNTDLQNTLGKLAVAILAVVAAFKTIKTISGVAGTVSKIGQAISGAGKTSSSAQGGFSGFASAVLMLAAAIGILAYSAVQIAQAGPGAVVAIISMVGGIVGLMAVAGAFGESLNGAATGLVAFGAAVLIAAAGIAVMAYAAIEISDAGAGAIAVFAGMGVGIAALMAVAAALAPALTAGSVGLLAFAAALLAIAAAAVAGAAAIAIIAGVLPTIVEYGASGAVALVELGAAMTVFAAGAALSGAGAAAAAVGFAALAVAAVAAVVPLAALAIEMATIGSAIATMADSGSTAASSLKEIKSASSGMLGAMTSLAAALPLSASALKKFASNTSKAVSPIAALLTSVVSLSAALAAAAVGATAFSTALRLINTLLTQLIGSIGMVTSVSDSIPASFTLITESAIPLAAALTALVSPVVMIVSPMMMLAAVLATVVSSLAVMNTAVMTANTQINTLLAAFQSVSAGVIASTTSMSSSVSSTLAGMYSNTTSVSGNIVSSMTTAWSQARTQTSTIFDQIGTSMQTSLNNAQSRVISSCKAIADGMKSAFSGLSSSFASIGLNIMSGLISGINSGSSGVINAMKNTINKAVAAAKAAAQIASPSKRFAKEVGSQIPAGIGQGVKNNTDAASDAVSDVVDKSSDVGGFIKTIADGFAQNKGRIKTAVQSAIGDMSILANASVVSAGTAKTVAGGSTDNSRNVNQNVNINNTFSGDRAIQKQTAKVMNKSAEDVTAILARGLMFAK